ncbi:MAG: biotin--[acetyl-CoA-carboxylase] ligase [Phycisphaerae bacterium]
MHLKTFCGSVNIMPEPVHQPKLTPDELLAGWTPRRVGRRIVVLPETSSTNTEALGFAEDSSADGLAILSDFQTAGRGRHGRAWLAPRGASVLCSVLLLERGQNSSSASDADRPTLPSSRNAADSPVGPSQAAMPWDPTGWLTLASAVAACEAIRRSTQITPAIKWPNDLRVEGRKLAGILIESRTLPAGRAYVVGVGINCYQQAGHFPPELRATATSLDLIADHPIDRVAVARELLRSLDEAVADTSEEAQAQVYDRWQEYAEPIGQRVHLRSDGRDYTGRTVAVDPHGGLILQLDDGRREWFDPLRTTFR